VTLRAVDDVTLTLSSEECVGLVGESGCGKSTLARMMVGLESPTAGEVLHLGVGVHDRAGWAGLRDSVQYVFQDPYGALPPRMTIDVMLDDVLRIAGISDGRERRRRIESTMELVGVRATELKRLPSEFSGGQRQRIGVARALLKEPEVVLLDEVTSSLDVSIQAQLLNLLVELRERLGVGFMFVSHDLRVIHYLADRVVVMYLGRVVESGPASQVFSSPLHPYTLGLLHSIPDHRCVHREVGRDRLGWIKGEPPNPTEQLLGCPFAPRCERVQDLCLTEDPAQESVDDRTVRCHFAHVLAPSARCS
jgi:oligopeptide/dipeptide ABC transporter ATP-binding protein